MCIVYLNKIDFNKYGLLDVNIDFYTFCVL